MEFDVADKLKDSVNPSLKILVVDDDELNQRMMRVLLTREGHVVHCASNGVDALSSVKSQEYDIVLMDLQMPVMDGVDASRRIREWENGGRHTFIVALTASYLPEKGQELFDAGIDNYLSKPFDMDHLRHILDYGLVNRKTVVKSDPGKSRNPEFQISEIFDYQKGIQRVGGDEDVYLELLSDFVQELPGKMENFRHYFEIKDLENLSRAAHNLKGVSASLGALQLSEHAQRLEKQADDGYTDSIEELLKEITVSTDKLRVDLSIYLSSRGLQVG